MLRVFIAGGDTGFCETLRSVFQSQREFHVCGESINEFEAVDKIVKHAPDLVILEVSARKDFKIAKVIKTVLPRVPLFIVTRQNDWDSERAALSQGVDAVFEKEDVSSLVMNARAACGME
jgi:DNA-binding NarL/FixJ family response regulator